MAEDIIKINEKHATCNGVSIPLQDFISQISENPPQILPHNCIFHHTRREYQYFLIEQPPTIRNLFWQIDWVEDPANPTNHKSGNYRNVRIALPYVLFFFFFQHHQYSNMRVFFRTQPLNSIDDPLLVATLHNTHFEGNVCLGYPFVYDHDKYQKYTQNPAKAVPYLIDRFWNSSFNLDINGIGGGWHHRPPTITNIQDWENITKTNPQNVLNLDWKRSPQTIRQLVADYALFPKLIENIHTVAATEHLLKIRAKEKLKL